MMMACVVVIVIQKRFDEAGVFWKVQKKFEKSSSVVVVIEGLGEQFFYNKNVTFCNTFCYKRNNFVIGKTMGKQWWNNGWVLFFRVARI